MVGKLHRKRLQTIFLPRETMLPVRLSVRPTPTYVDRARNHDSVISVPSAINIATVRKFVRQL